MPDLPESREMPNGIHDIVRCLSLRFVDYERAIKWRRLRLAWHFKKFSVISFQFTVFGS
jgi:hypothetical protein